ncbi:MAG: peptidylprolyl isomerase [Rikenellaceae bacterium]
MLKKILTLAAVVAITLPSIAEGRRVILDKVVAVVGSSSILYSDVETQANYIIERRKSEGFGSKRDAFSEAFETLLEQKLLHNQGMIDSVSVNKLDIESRVDQYINSLIAQEGGVAEVERRHNLALYNIRDNVRRKLEEQSYAQSMRYEISDNVSITPGDVKLFFESKDKDSLPMIGEQYVYAQITRQPESIEDAKFRVKERLLDMRERVISGSISFASLARMYSVDPGSAYRGGEMDPTPASAFTPPFADALEALQVGQISEIVETEYGLHIIELIDKKDDLYHCRHILLRPVFTPEELNEPSKFLDSLAGKIRSDSITFELAAKKYSDDAHSKMNGGIVSNHDLLEKANAYDAKLTVTRFLKEDFGTRGYKSIDDYMALTRLKIGEISSAFSTQDLNGNQMSKVVKLVDIIPAHTASLNEDYLQIEDMAIGEKQQEVLKKWLKRHIDAMYVYIVPEYRGLDFENKNWVK